MGPEAHSAFQRRDHVRATVGGQQGQYLQRLALAEALLAQQAVQEASRHRPQFGEAIAQHRLL